MEQPIRKIVIVGGGTAGWIAACVVAAETSGRGEPPVGVSGRAENTIGVSGRADNAVGVSGHAENTIGVSVRAENPVGVSGHADKPVRVVLVESPDVPAIGVGEGTWPSMRMTLQRIGLSEDDFVRDCDASFKQGTRFLGWSGRARAPAYTHPFSFPLDYAELNPARFWLTHANRCAFADLVTPQARVIDMGLAPKQVNAPQYAFSVNYGYHLDAGRFAELLRRHAVDKLGVRHVSGNVERIEARANADIEALALDTGERVDGDLFVDCTGQRALLIEGHHGKRLVPVRDTLFNDTAIVVQVPYAEPRAPIASATGGRAGNRRPRSASAEPGAPIASATLATAQPHGWIWDIGLGSRRGLGYVHSSAHVDEEAARATLEDHVRETSAGVDPARLSYRTIRFEPGYREKFWVGNCVAVGLSAGFVEPLEASALVLVEQSAAFIGEQLPRDRSIMDVVAGRFNAKMHYHWERIVEFLKLHYASGVRDDSDYWKEHREHGSWPDSLREKMTLWQQQPPWHDDAPRLDELFPSASYQYVLYGMGFRPSHGGSGGARHDGLRKRADDTFHRVRTQAQQMARLLPTTRELVSAVARRAAA